jgi:hypothetical protein
MKDGKYKPQIRTIALALSRRAHIEETLARQVIASLLLVLMAFYTGPAFASDEKVTQTEQEQALQSNEEKCGVKIESVQLSAAGHIVDLRYRVTDAEKAAAVFDRKNKAYLLDQETGTALAVPRTAKVGPLRQTNFKPDPKRVYFILFSNAGGVVKSGSLVTLVVGESRLEDIKVQ